jgi:hypothetical protein
LLNLAEILSVFSLGVFVLERELLCISQSIKMGTIMCTIWMGMRREKVFLRRQGLSPKQWSF